LQRRRIAVAICVLNQSISTIAICEIPSIREIRDPIQASYHN